MMMVKSVRLASLLGLELIWSATRQKPPSTFTLVCTRCTNKPMNEHTASQNKKHTVCLQKNEEHVQLVQAANPPSTCTAVQESSCRPWV